MISFDEWKKIDLRVARIIKVDDISNAENLYLLKVDLRNEKRQLVAGLKPYYKKEELLNKLCIVFTNLEPAMIRGIKSEGMLLAAVKNGKVVIISPEKEIEEGARIE